MVTGFAYHNGEVGRAESSPLGRIDFDRMLKDKLSRARDAMKRYELGAVLCLTEPNIAYTTNVPPMAAVTSGIGGNRYSILPSNSDVIAFEEAATAYHLRYQLAGSRVEFAVPAWGGPYNATSSEAKEYLVSIFAEQVHSILKELKLDKEKIGIDVDVPYVTTQLRHQGLNVSLEGGTALLEARTIKTPEEIECVRALATVIDGCFGVMARELKPGVKEREVFAKCISYAIEQGLSADGGYLVSGPHTWPKDSSRQSTDRRIRPGDVVYADFFNLGFFGYRSCYYRTFSIGRASKEVKETYDKVYRWLKLGEEKLRPGVTTKDIVEQWPDEVQLWSQKPPFIRNQRDALSTFFQNMGHAIGLHLYEPPFFWRPTSMKWPQRIEGNMTIALETLDATPDNRFGVRIEDMIVITDSGYEVLSRWPAEEITEIPLY